MIVQPDSKMMREQSSSRSVASPPSASAPDQSLGNSLSSSGLLYQPSAAAAAAAAALSMAGAFPFGPFGTLGGLRMLANQSSMSFPAGMLGLRHPLLPFGLQHHPSGTPTSSPSNLSNRPYVFPYNSATSFQQQQQQQQQLMQQRQPQQQQQQPQPQQQLGSPACGSAAGVERSTPAERGERYPHTPPTSPSLDENTDLNKTGN